jgi:hypothetical protein
MPTRPGGQLACLIAPGGISAPSCPVQRRFPHLEARRPRHPGTPTLAIKRSDKIGFRDAALAASGWDGVPDYVCGQCCVAQDLRTSSRAGTLEISIGAYRVGVVDPIFDGSTIPRVPNAARTDWATYPADKWP